MIAKLGLIVSDLCQVEEDVKSLPEVTVDTPHGLVTVKIGPKWAVICRSGLADGAYALPHEYNTAGHLAAFKQLGLEEVVGVHSSGSLRPSLAPGVLIIPDDWINFTSPPLTTISGQRRHLTPSFSKKVRQRLVDASWKAQLRFENGGVYWQSPGPRLETKAEIKVMSNFADIVGMGLADEANLAQEFDLEYGAVCSVDNYAHGLGLVLTDEVIRDHSIRSVDVISHLLAAFE